MFQKNLIYFSVNHVSLNLLWFSHLKFHFIYMNRFFLLIFFSVWNNLIYRMQGFNPCYLCVCICVCYFVRFIDKLHEISLPQSFCLLLDFELLLLLILIFFFFYFFHFLVVFFILLNWHDTYLNLNISN